MQTSKTLIVALLMGVILVSSFNGGLLASGLPAAAGPKVTEQPYVPQPRAQTTIRALSTPQIIESAREAGRIDADTANLYLAYALAAPDRLPAEYHGTVPWDGTLPLLRLRESVSTMAVGAARSSAESLLNTICQTSTLALELSISTDHFFVEYDAIGGDLTIDDYTDSLETAWSTEVDSFGWAAPPALKDDPPPGGRYHVRIDDLPTGLYGYVSNDGTYAGLVGDNPATTEWNEGDAYATCMVLNDDFDPLHTTAQQALDGTVAHELNHAIQYGYGAMTGPNVPDYNLIEGGATWMMDEVFDSSDLGYNFLWPQFDRCMGEYTTDPTLSCFYWITLRGLTEPYGTGTSGGGEQVMQDFWEETSQSLTNNMLPALDLALLRRDTTLADAYHAYAVAVKFNKTCAGGYVYPYCFEEGADYVSAAGATKVQDSIAAIGDSVFGSVEDNYALNWISLPTSGSPYTVTLQNTSTGGQLRASVVCDTGTALEVDELPAVVGRWDSTALVDYDPTGCDSVVAVITNQAQTAGNPGTCTPRSYTLTTAEVPDSPGGAYLPLVLSNYPKLLVNGDFEDGRTGWQEFSSSGAYLILPAEVLGLVPHSGSWAALLGGDSDAVSYVQQQVTVLSGAPYLAYWHWIASRNDCGHDSGQVLINGSIVVDSYDLCEDSSTGGWVEHSVNLGAYAGQTVWVRIQVETNGPDNSNLFVDDVSFQSSAALAMERVTLAEHGASKSRGGAGGTTPRTEVLLRP